jgi:hypothetical protein
MGVERRSAAAGLLMRARHAAGLTQAALAERAGVPQTMISAYERDLRQPTLETLLRLLKAAGFELRMHLAPYDDHDDVLAEWEATRPEGEYEEWLRHVRAGVGAVLGPVVSGEDG